MNGERVMMDNIFYRLSTQKRIAILVMALLVLTVAYNEMDWPSDNAPEENVTDNWKDITWTLPIIGIAILVLLYCTKKSAKTLKVKSKPEGIVIESECLLNHSTSAYLLNVAGNHVLVSVSSSFNEFNRNSKIPGKK